QQAVYAAQVNERTVVGEVLDDTLDNLAFLQGFQQCFALGAVLVFEYGTAGNDNVVALLVQLDDLEFQFLAFQVRGIANRTDIDHRTRQERTNDLDVLLVFDRGFTADVVLGFVYGTAVNDNVVAFLVQLAELAFQFLAFRARGIATRTDIDQRTRQDR